MIFISITLGINTGWAQRLQEEFYPLGQLKAKGLVMDSFKEGEWLFFYPSGVKSAVENYKSGKLNGVITYYYPNSVVQGIENWKEGVLQDSAYYYHLSGNLHRKGIYRQSQYEGKWISYFDNGNY